MSLLYLDTVDSTNTYCRNHFPELADGTLVAAGEQTAGRGRLDRKWLAVPGSCLTATFVMKQVPAEPFYATCCLSLAVLELLRATAPGIPFYIKWPNDVYCDGRKIAGILSEGIVQQGKIAGIVAGAGININLTEKELAAIDQPAVSLSTLTNCTFDVKNMLVQFEKCLDICYITCSSNPQKLFEDWKRENHLLGMFVDFERPDGVLVTGVLSEIFPDGSIEVSGSGAKEIFRCGDIRISKKFLSETEERKI